MNLYNIANEYQLLLDQTFDPETGELNELALAKLDEVKADVKEKGIAIASFIKNIEAERDAIENAKKNMAEREARLDRRVSSLTSYLQSNMERCGINEISSPYFMVKLKKNPVSVDIFNESALPENYIKTKTSITHSIDKVKIKEDILNGVAIPGATLRQNVRLEIR